MRSQSSFPLSWHSNGWILCSSATEMSVKGSYYRGTEGCGVCIQRVSGA